MRTQKPLGRMTKVDLYLEAQERGAGFIANVIDCWHRRPFTRLAGLVALLRAGREVRTGQFSMDTLVIDGESADWTELDRAADKAKA